MTQQVTRPVTEQERLHDVAARLSRISREKAYNVYERFTWPDELPADRYWMSPELTTPFGTPVWDELTEDQRLVLSRREAVNFFSLNVHLIRELIGGVTDRIYTTRFPGLSEFFHDFISEENEHMWFFATFCRRYGGEVYPSGKGAGGGGADGRHPAVQDVMMFGRILIAEELCDAFNSRMGTDARLPALVQEINLVHHQDESRHIAFGRQMMRALADEVRDAVGPEGLAEAADYLGRYLSVCLRSFYNPAVYADAGLPKGRALRSRLVADPGRQRIHRELMERTTTFLHRIGLCDPETVAW